MKILVHIQVPEDGIELYHAYEDHVLPLLAKHSGTLIDRHVSKTGTEEFHLIEFNEKRNLAEFKNDPDRIAAQPLWEQSDATAKITELA